MMGAVRVTQIVLFRVFVTFNCRFVERLCRSTSELKRFSIPPYYPNKQISKIIICLSESVENGFRFMPTN